MENDLLVAENNAFRQEGEYDSMLMSTADLGMRFLPFELQHWASLVVQFAKSLPAKQETQVRCLG